MSMSNTIEHTPGDWVSVGGSAMYENIIGNVQPAEDTFAAKYARPGEVAAEPVCRVHKHSRGAANAALICALPKLLAACEVAEALDRYLEMGDSIDHERVEITLSRYGWNVSDDPRAFIRNLRRAALTAARTASTQPQKEE